MKREFNIKGWYRESTFSFFRNFADPFLQIDFRVDVSRLLKRLKQNRESFFLHSLWCSQFAVNEIDEFKLRIEGDKVYLYETVHCGSTVLNSDNSFGYCYFDHFSSREKFISAGTKALEIFKKEGNLDPRDGENAMIHYSVVPWISFTGIKHARNSSREDSIPKIVFGRYFNEGKKTWMPVSLSLHHSLADGYHCGLYYEKFQGMLNQDY